MSAFPIEVHVGQHEAGPNVSSQVLRLKLCERDPEQLFSLCVILLHAETIAVHFPQLLGRPLDATIMPYLKQASRFPPVVTSPEVTSP
jgi:hypothetical protein